MSRQHRIDYIELSAISLTRAKAFYASAFGWSFNDYGPAYAGITNESGREPGGIAKLEDGSDRINPASGSPLIVLFSDDLDATQCAIIKAGGTITTKPFDFPGGRRFHFADTEGNELAVWCEMKRPGFSGGSNS